MKNILTVIVVFSLVFSFGCKERVAPIVRHFSLAERIAAQAKADVAQARFEREEKERKLSENYQLAKQYEGNWMTYAEIQAARIPNPNPTPEYMSRPEKNLNDALEYYLEVAKSEPLAYDDVARVARIILYGDPIEKAYARLAKKRKGDDISILPLRTEGDNALWQLLERWKSTQYETIRALLTEYAKAYRKDLRTIGFDSTKRYRSEIDLRGVSWEDSRRLTTNCGQHEGHINKLANLTAVLNTEDKKVWALHATDVSISDFCCDCSGDYYRDPLANSEAYERYLELGDTATAKRVALTVAKEILDLYANGKEASGYYPDERTEPIPILLAENKAEAEKWFHAAGWDKGTVKTVFAEALRKAAADKEAEQHYSEAHDLYAVVGEKEKARKMELLAGGA